MRQQFVSNTDWTIECRRRKQRCDGLTPCNVCSRRGSHCRYRSFLRNRATKALLAQRRNQKRSSQAATSGSDDTEAQNTPEQRESESPDNGNGIIPLRECIFNSVRATYAAPESPSSLLQLYYGPSSNFSFLQHIHSHLKERRASQTVSDDNDGNAGIDKFKYKGIVFGSVANKGSAASPVFLRYELAKSFIQNFLSATHHFFPLLDPDRLCFTFERLYGSRQKQDPIEPLEKAAVIIAMAMGAISTREEEWRERLLAQARTEAESVRYHVNVRAVQIAMLMAHCEFTTGHPNLAYLSLGNAVTKAFAAGIHKKGRGSERPEANWTMWNLFCNESISCLMFGRPHLLHRETIDIPPPDRPSYMAAMIQLSIIMRRTHRMYFHHERSTIADMVESAHEIRHELESFSNLIKQDIGVWIGGPTCPVDAERLTWHIVTNYCTPLLSFVQEPTDSHAVYFYTMLLAFRPLLLLQVELKRYIELQIDGHSRPNTGRYQMPALLNGQEQYCIDAARSIIFLSESILTTVPSTQVIFSVINQPTMTY